MHACIIDVCMHLRMNHVFVLHSQVPQFSSFSPAVPQSVDGTDLKVVVWLLSWDEWPVSSVFPVLCHTAQNTRHCIITAFRVWHETLVYGMNHTIGKLYNL